MRSDRPIPGNPWPHDMVLSVDSPNALLDLLWIREAHGLQVRGADLPPLLEESPEPSPTTVPAEERTRWAAAWPFVWDAALEHAAGEKDEQDFDRLQETAGGSVERAELLGRIIGPTWRERFGDGAFDEAHDHWSGSRFDRLKDEHRLPLEEHPERRCLTETIPAWRAGLLTVITIPCRGSFTRVVGAHGLLVTERERADPGAYRSALRRFAEDVTRR